jgi:hypothetical protein
LKHWGALVELLVVIVFAVGWGILELVTLRMDRRRKAAANVNSPDDSAGAGGAGDPRHPEG